LQVEEIATYVNESKREEEAVLTFSVVKMNQFNKDTPRVFELDVAAKTLSVLKQENVKVSSFFGPKKSKLDGAFTSQFNFTSRMTTAP